MTAVLRRLFLFNVVSHAKFVHNEQGSSKGPVGTSFFALDNELSKIGKLMVVHALRSLALFGALALAAAGCGPAVTTTAKIAPKSPEAAELTRVTVLGFSGRHADQVNAIFEASLVDHRFDDQPHFTVVDRARTTDLMREYGNALRGEIEPSTAARFGRQIGAQGVYFGDITRAEVTRRSYPGTETYCARHNRKGRCQQQQTRSITCYERVAAITLVPRLVDVESGQVVYRGLQSGEAKSSSCGGAERPEGELLEEAIRTAVAGVLADVAPRNQSVRVALMDKPSVLGSSDAAEFSRGVVFAKEQRMDRACQIWTDLDSRTGRVDNALLFNIAMCREVDGDYGGALELMEQVDNRLDRPDRNVSDSLVRLRASMLTN